MTNKRIYFLMTLTAFFWSGSFIAGKLSSPFIPPFTLTFLRFSTAALILYPILKKRDGIVYKLTRRDIPVFLFTGVFGMAGHHVLFFIALKHSSAVNLSIINATNPIITSLLSIILLGEIVTLNKALGIALSFTGILLAMINADVSTLGNISFNQGDLIMAAAVVVWACYYVFSKKIIRNYTPMTLVFYSFIFCIVSLVPFVLYEMPWRLIKSIPFYSYLAVLYMGLFPTVIGFVVQQMAIQEIGPSKTSAFSNLVPIFSIILSVIMLGETINLVKVSTAFLIVSGVYLCQRRTGQVKSVMRKPHAL